MKGTFRLMYVFPIMSYIINGGAIMERKKYFVSLQSREISQTIVGNNADFTIYATDDEVRMLRKKMDNIYDAEVDTYWRAHVPIMPYHKDASNERYDQSLTEVFKMIYTLGDEQAKQFVSESEVLRDKLNEDL